MTKLISHRPTLVGRTIRPFCADEEAMRVKQFIVFGLMLAVSLSVAHAADARGGLWVSKGYGLFFRIDPSKIEASEITSVSCLPAWTATRAADRENAWVYRGGFASGEEVIRIYPGHDADNLVLRRTDDMAAMQLVRVKSPPVACNQPAQDTPLANFDVLWTTFAENYPFFQAHGVDWVAMRQKFRPMVTAKTTPDELFSLFSRMLEPLHDSHVVLDVFPANTPRGKDWLKTPVKEV